MTESGKPSQQVRPSVAGQVAQGAERRAYATFSDGTLTVGNALIERRWTLHDGRLYATSLRHTASQREWCHTPSTLAGLATSVASDPPSATPTLTTRRSRDHHVEAESLTADLVLSTPGGKSTLRFKLFDDLAAIGMQLIVDSAAITTRDDVSGSTSSPTGIEHDAPAPTAAIDPTDILDAFPIDPLHHWLLATRFVEQTDHHNNLVFEDRWSIFPSEPNIALPGNLFYLEHRPTGTGLAMLKIAPSPKYRPVKNAVDLQITRGHVILRGHGLDDAGGEGYMQWIVAYQGDRAERIAAIQSLQQRLRPYVPGRDGVLLTNTWGDRSRDAALNEAFLMCEIEAAAAMNVDVLQIDDGWQKGITANSSLRDKGGVWNGFWAADAEFWSANRERFPNGLEPIAQACAKAGLQLGLWYAPDSTNDMANWLRDAEQIIALHRSLNVCHVKIDAVKMHSKTCERRLALFYDRVLNESAGRVTFDADVTAEVRPGYWGQPRVGVVFVENRYTDWHNYWPHHTLRNLWRLAHHIHPLRLRMEFLNPFRHQEKYAGDPLAPANYAPAALFAGVMFSSPLSWMELSNAPASFRDEVAALAAVWTQHRDTIFRSVVIPIGDEPDGYSWCGFVTHSEGEDDYAVIYRPLGENARWSFSAGRRKPVRVDWLSGHGTASIVNGNIEIQVTAPLGYGFVRIAF